MKKIIASLTTVLLSIASANAQAITLNPDYTVDGIIAADVMTNYTGVFYDWSSPDLSVSSQRDPADSITSDNLFNTFAYSLGTNASVELGFSTSIYNGAGNDLAFFMVGNPALLDFSAIVRDDFGNSMLISDNSTFDVQFEGNLIVGGIEISLSTVLIDLDNYGSDVFGANPLTKIQFNFGSEFGSPGLSLAGGIHSTATVVPLPLPLVLFGSGLGLLGLMGRRKKSAA